MQNNEEFQKALISAGLSLALLDELGFEFATQSNLVQKLRGITPIGRTSMRDAVMIGIDLLLRLHTILKSLGTAQVWNFVHIVLTDGEDTSSKSTLNDSINIMRRISQEIQVNVLKTYIIGVNVNANDVALNELKALANAGGENSEFHNVSDVEISQIFERIIVLLGIVNRTNVVAMSNENQSLVVATEQREPAILLKEQRYVCLFTLDMSHSMKGNKWNTVCNSVASFISYLGPTDLVAGIVFNEQSLILLNKRPPIPSIPKIRENPAPQIDESKKIDFDIFIYFAFIGIIVSFALKLNFNF